MESGGIWEPMRGRGGSGEGEKELLRLRGWVGKTTPGREEDWRTRRRKEAEGG